MTQRNAGGEWISALNAIREVAVVPPTGGGCEQGTLAENLGCLLRLRGRVEGQVVGCNEGGSALGTDWAGGDWG